MSKSLSGEVIHNIKDQCIPGSTYISIGQNIWLGLNQSFATLVVRTMDLAGHRGEFVFWFNSELLKLNPDTHIDLNVVSLWVKPILGLE